MKFISAIAVIVCGALASVQAFAGMPSAGFQTVGFHGGGHGGGFHGGGQGDFHRGHPGFHGDARFGVFIGPPLFWPWYYPPAYYGPPGAYYNPTPSVIYSTPPVAVVPSAPDYYPAPNVAAPGSASNPVMELPSYNAAPRQSPAQLPPQGQLGDALAQAPPGQLFMYPRQGQDEPQQGRDRDECYRWALGQIGYDPGKSTAGLSPAQITNYYRAMGACLDGRGYSVR
jgi:hypothetical protein